MTESAVRCLRLDFSGPTAAAEKNMKARKTARKNQYFAVRMGGSARGGKRRGKLDIFRDGILHRAREEYQKSLVWLFVYP
jgi:hypothetical protein